MNYLLKLFIDQNVIVIYFKLIHVVVAIRANDKILKSVGNELFLLVNSKYTPTCMPHFPLQPQPSACGAQIIAVSNCYSQMQMELIFRLFQRKFVLL